MLTIGDLFSGIGGFSLGLERAGMRTAWFAEVDPYASAVLRKHWPDVPNYGDVRSISAAGLRARDVAAYGPMGYPVGHDGRSRRARGSDSTGEGQCEPQRTFSFPDVLVGGFPCQDISNAGKRAGIDGERSGLWGEFARIIGELRPRYVIVENVAALLGRGIERVLGDLAALGFDAEWHCIPASAVGAPHRRDRVWIVAYANGCDGRGRAEAGRVPATVGPGSAAAGDVAYATSAHAGRRAGQPEGAEPCERLAPFVLPDARCNCGAGCAGRDNGARDVPDADGCEQGRRLEQERRSHRRDSDAAGDGAQRHVADADGDDEHGRRRDVQMGWGRRAREIADDGRLGNAQWGTQSGLGVLVDGIPADLVRWSDEPEGVPRVAIGVENRVDQLRCLGNSIVPRIAEVLGRAIVRAA